jgi:hypothetical protein
MTAFIGTQERVRKLLDHLFVRFKARNNTLLDEGGHLSSRQLVEQRNRRFFELEIDESFGRPRLAPCSFSCAALIVLDERIACWNT